MVGLENGNKTKQIHSNIGWRSVRCCFLGHFPWGCDAIETSMKTAVQQQEVVSNDWCAVSAARGKSKGVSHPPKIPLRKYRFRMAGNSTEFLRESRLRSKMNEWESIEFGILFGIRII